MKYFSISHLKLLIGGGEGGRGRKPLRDFQDILAIRK